MGFCYDFPIGRFINEGPAWVGGGMNMASYVGTQPILHSDPAGKNLMR
jgi:RHS repeat-associated protein